MSLLHYKGVLSAPCSFEISIFPDMKSLESLFIIYLSPYSECGHKRIIATMNRSNTTK